MASTEKTMDSSLIYHSQRFFDDIKSNETAVHIINYTLSNVDRMIDDKLLFELEANILAELSLLQIDKLASASYLPCDEDLIDDDSSFWDIETEAAPLPIDLWASGIGKLMSNQISSYFFLGTILMVFYYRRET